VKQQRGVYLVGFSGTGKSTIAKELAKALNWPPYDLDDLIVQQSGVSIPQIFQREGEPGFRRRETEMLQSISVSGAFVLATGGGTFINPTNRQIMAGHGWSICLEARPTTVFGRIQHQLKAAAPNAIRPMLDAVYPLDQIRTLKKTRQPIYALADWTIHTDRLSVLQIVQEITRALDVLNESSDPPDDISGAPMRHSLNTESPPPIVIQGGPWPYYVVVDWGHLFALGSQLQHFAPEAKQVAIVTDKQTWARLGPGLEASLRDAKYEVRIREAINEERIKSLDETEAIHNWLADLNFRRDDVVFSLGGGAIDDVTSFAASTYMRGVPLVKVPTSLECMVDSSIGGKTSINHPRARNLIGTFFHPRLVWSDLSLLKDEDPSERDTAWAEVVKYAMLESSLLRGEVIGSTLFEQLEKNVEGLIMLDRPTLLTIVARCVALKARVIEADERDLGQYRVFLNYGHTIGHALETATGYRLKHGDAVAVGMGVEAALAVRVGLADPSVEERQDELLHHFHLPNRLPPVSLDLIWELVNRDKKVSGNSPRWILPVEIGRAIVSKDVTESDLRAVLKSRSGRSN
jgi:shikimate kinase / 3-dehydroquinate synthase